MYENNIEMKKNEFTVRLFQIWIRKICQSVSSGQDPGLQVVLQVVSEVSRRPGDRLWPRHDARACQVSIQWSFTITYYTCCDYNSMSLQHVEFFYLRDCGVIC